MSSCLAAKYCPFCKPIHWHQIRLQQIIDTIQQILNLYLEHQKIFSISNTSSYNTHRHATPPLKNKEKVTNTSLNKICETSVSVSMSKGIKSKCLCLQTLTWFDILTLTL